MNIIYVLKDKKVLPPSGRFVDPYDHSEFAPMPDEDFKSFARRVESARVKKGYPSYPRKELESFIEYSLAQTVSEKVLNKYFEGQAVLPQFSQIFSLAQTLLAERNEGRASYVERQERARHCLSGCRFHQTQGGMAAWVSKAISRFVGMGQMQVSENEAKLGTCAMCGCGLKNKVRFNILNILAATAPDDIAKLVLAYKEKAFDICWILGESCRDIHLKKILRDKIEKSSTPGLVEYLDGYGVSKFKSVKKNV